jgi:hypothetical protein
VTAVKLPTTVRRGNQLAKRLGRNVAKAAIKAGVDVLQEQQDAVRALLNNMKDCTAQAETEAIIARDLIRENARTIIISALATPPEAPATAAAEPAATAAAADEPINRHLGFGQPAARKGGKQQNTKDGTVNLRVNGRQ